MNPPNIGMTRDKVEKTVIHLSRLGARELNERLGVDTFKSGDTLLLDQVGEEEEVKAALMADDWTLSKEELQQQTARAAIERLRTKEIDMATTNREGTVTQINRKLREKGIDATVSEKPQVSVQQELIEDARQTKKLPTKLRNKLAPLCEAEELAGSNRLRATELLEEIQTMMAELEIPQIALPNGGKVIYSETKKARYQAPPKKKAAAVDDGGGEDSEDRDEE